MTKHENHQTHPAAPVRRLQPIHSLLGALSALLLLGVAVVIGATTSSILISKNETNFSEKGDNYSYLSTISYSGQFVAFDSKASNLDQDWTDSFSGWDIFFMDRDADADEIFDWTDNVEKDPVEISLITRGANADCRYPMLARKSFEQANRYEESRFVVFQSGSTFFNYYDWTNQPYETQWDPGPYTDIFLYDSSGLNGPTIYAISRSYHFPDPENLTNDHSGSPGPIPVSIGNPVHAGAALYLDSPNNPWVVFESKSTNLVSPETNGMQHIFLREVREVSDASQNGVTTLLSVNLETGAEANGHSTNPVVSSDGRFVAFVSYATNLVPDPAIDGSKAQVYLLDRDFDGNGTYDEMPPSGSRKYYLVSGSGEPGNGDSFTPSIGETLSERIRVSFSSDADNLVGGDTNGYRDIFMAEITRGVDGHTIKNVSHSVTGEQGNNISTAPTISGDGLVVSFTSYATNLVFNDNNYDCLDENDQPSNCPDVFSKAVDLGPEFIWRTSLTMAGEQSQANSGTTQLDGTGKYATFVTFADLIGTGAMDPYQQIYVRDHGNPPGNPIVSPSSWKYLGLEPGESQTQEFTLTFLDRLYIEQVYIQTDQTGYRFSILSDGCSNKTFYQNDICTFTVQYTARLDDPLGSVHLDNIIILLPEDPRDNLKVALEGRVSYISYNPLVMIQ